MLLNQSFNHLFCDKCCLQKGLLRTQNLYGARKFERTQKVKNKQKRVRTYNPTLLKTKPSSADGKPVNEKCILTPTRIKQAQEVTFPRKTRKDCHLSLSFNNQPTEKSAVHQRIELILNEKLLFLSFTKSIDDQINNSLKGVGLPQKLRTFAYYP